MMLGKQSEVINSRSCKNFRGAMDFSTGFAEKLLLTRISSAITGV